MTVDENERLGREALTLFVGILVDHFATMEDDDELDIRLLVEDYLNAQPTETPPDGIASRLRLIAEAVHQSGLN
jgi:hypothetical protein